MARQRRVRHDHPRGSVRWMEFRMPQVEASGSTAAQEEAAEAAHRMPDANPLRQPRESRHGNRREGACSESEEGKKAPRIHLPPLQAPDRARRHLPPRTLGHGAELGDGVHQGPQEPCQRHDRRGARGRPGTTRRGQRGARTPHEQLAGHPVEGEKGDEVIDVHNLEGAGGDV